MLLRLTAIALVLAAFPAAGSAARRSDPTPPPSPVARLVACSTASSDRSATFFARMDAVPGTAKMQLRFQLFQRLGLDTAWTRIDVPALRVWHSSAPGINRLVWKQTVDGLHVGGAYRAHVVYRWLASDGSLLAAQSRDTTSCRGPLPNLVVGALTVNPGPTPDTRTYSVNLANTGKADVDQVPVEMRVDKAELDTITVSHLAAGDSRTVSFTGPVCRRAIRVTADPNNTIGETLKGDNSQLFACP